MSTESLRPYPTALLNPLADPIFKILFTTDSPESKEALRCFLCDILGKEVTDVTLQPNELVGECLSDKQTEFDINCKLPDDVEKLTKPQLWGKFFLNASRENKQDFVKLLCEKNRGIKMATETLSLASEEHLNWYHESRYWMHVSDELTMKRAATLEGREKGLKEGLQQGIEQGRIEGAKAISNEIAKKMKISGTFSRDQIIELTGISKEDFDIL